MNISQPTSSVSNSKLIKKPIISWWKSSDPCRKLNILAGRLTDITIIETKNLTDEFINFCISNKDRIYLHITINGMGGSMFEKNIMTVKTMFLQMRKLIGLGFSQNRILVIVKPILPNQNGLNALQLLLKVFTEFQPLRLRRVRFEILKYYKVTKESKFGPKLKDEYQIANRNISERHTTKLIKSYLVHAGSEFFREYYKLINSYNGIIHVEQASEPIIGFRELSSFGLKSYWEPTGEKMIEYDTKTKQPKVLIISEKNAVRCGNACLLCEYRS